MQKDQNNLAKTEIQSTGMHSSRIRAARSLPHAGSLCLGVSLIETSGQRHPPDRDTPRQRPPWTETPLDRDPLDIDPPGQRETPWTEIPPSGQTNTCDNTNLRKLPLRAVIRRLFTESIINWTLDQWRLKLVRNRMGDQVTYRRIRDFPEAWCQPEMCGH